MSVTAASRASAPLPAESNSPPALAPAAAVPISASPPSAILNQEEAASASFAASDDDAPIGPSEDEESAYLAEANGFGGAEFAGGYSASYTAALEDEVTGPLPSLAALQEKIPPATLALLDELFRAKFTRVERVRPKDLKP